MATAEEQQMMEDVRDHAKRLRALERRMDEMAPAKDDKPKDAAKK